MGTVSGFLSIAGAALTTIGAVTGKKDLMKVGGFMSLGGGIGTAMTAAAGSAGTAAEAFRASELAAQGGSAASMAAPIAEAALPSMTMEPAGTAMTDFGEFKLPIMQQAAERAGSAAGGLDLGGFGQSVTDGMNVGSPAVASTVLSDPSVLAPSVQSAAGKIAEGASTMDSGQLAGYLKSGYDAVKPIASGALDFVEKNPLAASIGMSALSSMYGPQAEQMDFNKSIYERRMRNLNSPVKLNFGGA